MNKEKALKNQGLEFREDIDHGGGETITSQQQVYTKCSSIRSTRSLRRILKKAGMLQQMREYQTVH